MKEKRTYSWYVLNQFWSGKGGESYSVAPDEKYVNAPSPQVHLDHFKELGLHDEVPTLDNLIPLIDRYGEWYARVDENWDVYREEEAKRGLMVTLHCTLSNILSDPSIDERILRHVVKHFTKFDITVVTNSSCPEDVLESFIRNAGSKSDSTRETKGGEITCFILQNKFVSSRIVDLCARKTKRATIQRDAAGHPNVSRETLVYLSKEGRSETVKRDALRTLVAKGWLEVK